MGSERKKVNCWINKRENSECTNKVRRNSDREKDKNRKLKTHKRTLQDSI